MKEGDLCPSTPTQKSRLTKVFKKYQRILLSKYVIHGKYVILMQIWQYNADMARLYEIVGIARIIFNLSQR